MKADLRLGGEDGPDREELRRVLRQWDVPPPPAEIEEDLRRTFRRRRARGRPALWLSLAAALALIAVWRIGLEDRAVTPAPAERPIAVATPLPLPPGTLEPDRPLSSPRAAGEPSAPMSAARRPRRPTPALREAEVMVEPGQARLLAELGRTLRDVRQAAPGASIPRIERAPADAPPAITAADATEVPQYRGDWETVAGEWPYVHRSRPACRR